MKSFYKYAIYSLLYIFTFSIIYSTVLIKPDSSNAFPILRIVIIFFSSILLYKYIVYMILCPWHDVQKLHRRKKFKEIAKTYNPRVSIMIPAWNEAKGIITTLESITKSDYRNLEVIIINDGSTDDSHTLIQGFIKKYQEETGAPEKGARPSTQNLSALEPKKNLKPIDIIYIYKENGGKAVALNTAIERSTGEILLSIDADCFVLPDTVKNFVAYFTDSKVMAAVGNVKIGNTRHLIGVVQYLEFLFSFYFKKADSLMNTIYIIGGAAGAFRREVFEKIGKYNTTNITEDIEFSVRIQGEGMRIVYANDAIVYTEGARRLRDLMKQRLRWKRGRFETFFTHKYMFFSVYPPHNKILSWIILPMAYFGELQLSLELFFLGFLYIYSYFIRDYSSFISGIVIVGSMFFVQMFFDERGRKKSKRFIFLAPIGWLLLYVSTFVEFNALLKSIWGLIRKKELKWQTWRREGLSNY